MNVSCLEQDIARGGGVLLGILAGGVPVSPFQTNLKCHFPHPFSDLEEITKRNMFTKTEIISSLLMISLERRQKDFLKFIFYSHTSCGLFLIHLEPFDKYVHTPP